MMLVLRGTGPVPLKETRAGMIVSIILSMVSMGTLSVCLCKPLNTQASLNSNWISTTSSECQRLVKIATGLLVYVKLLPRSEKPQLNVQSDSSYIPRFYSFCVWLCSAIEWIWDRLFSFNMLKSCPPMFGLLYDDKSMLVSKYCLYIFLLTLL